MKRVLAVVLLCGVLAGCTASQSWQLGVSGSTEQVNSEYRFTGDVSLSGNTGGVNVEGVQVVFLDSNETQIARLDVGSLGEDRRVSHIDITLDTVPEYVLVRVVRISAPNNSQRGITGAKRGADGLYYTYSDYDPVVRNSTTRLL